jgi:hypothetical protein
MYNFYLLSATRKDTLSYDVKIYESINIQGLIEIKMKYKSIIIVKISNIIIVFSVFCLAKYLHLLLDILSEMWHHAIRRFILKNIMRGDIAKKKNQKKNRIFDNVSSK